MRFYASSAFESVLKVDAAAEYVKSGIHSVLKCMLALMRDFDNEELGVAFESIMSYYGNAIAPYALEICNHLKEQYIRLVKQDQENEDEEGESIMAALQTLSSVRQVLQSIQKKPDLMRQVESLIYPCLLHSVTIDGLDSIEEGLDCIAMVLFCGYKDTTTGISAELWRLYPQMMFITVGSEDNPDGGAGFEFVSQICAVLRNYFSRDPDSLLRVAPDSDKTFLQQTFLFIKRCLEVNRNGEHYLDGIAIMGLIIALLENMQGKIDEHIGHILNLVVQELNYVKKKKAAKFKGAILEAFASLFTYNAGLVFSILGNELNAF